MAKVNLPYVNSFRDRHGKLRHYFRRGRVSVALPGAPGGQTFSEEYDELLALHGPANDATPAGIRLAARQPARGTLTWVVAQYRSSDNADWAKLKPSTRVVYDRLFDWLRERYGSGMFVSLRERHVR